MDGNVSQEIEPNTFVPTSGSEKGLPHHLFTPDEFRSIFPKFEVLDLQVVEDRIIALTATKSYNAPGHTPVTCPADFAGCAGGV